ncbi:hypothetical protein FEM48_Zijuj01G0324600 [Ziziphus jujuba var. spinosa]|uniref:peptidylprolyl isomerase n=1 Tax=Ziziphus jujuba var. spinosa TaxID=714518 RepID=A0A978W6J3_ZIZJJ|nr:hypothetical protein FEM48_Zijuj01G0324600 [Ziziphus jujuba var. spinosa]
MIAMNTPLVSWTEDGCHPKSKGERLKQFQLPSKQTMSLSIIMKPDACGVSASNNMTTVASNTKLLRSFQILPATFAVLSGAKDAVEISPSEFENFSVTAESTNESGEIKLSIEVSGTTTQTIFDEVFDKMVEEAQPIPGFRRVKGGEIPKNILLEVLGPSNVFKKVIERVINSTIAEYVEKGDLKVSKDLRVEQSFEDLEAMFEAGEEFSFSAVLRLQEMN